VLCTSTIGVSPVTVMVSSIAPTRRSAFTDAVNVPVSSMPSRLTELKPASVKVTEYVPGRRFSILYWDQRGAGGFHGDARQHRAGSIFDHAGDGRLRACQRWHDHG
jgi:hypothetical protein